MTQRELALRRIDHQISAHNNGVKVLSRSELRRLRRDLARYRAELTAERADLSARQVALQADNMSPWWQRSAR